MLAASDVLTDRYHARLYDEAFTRDAPAGAELSERVEGPSVREELDRLVEAGVLERTSDGERHRYDARAVRLDVETDDGTHRITPALFATLARRARSGRIRAHLGRHGLSGLASALEYVRNDIHAEMNARVMAYERDLLVVEAERILRAVRGVLADLNFDAGGGDPDGPAVAWRG